jgi:putative two-component system response regulator
LFQDIEDIVRCHHECFDGDGYPNGIEGEAIPYLARIMKILDVYCAMTSPRIYREGHATHTDAIAHLREEAGKHFDPVLTKAFIAGKVGKTEH